MLIPLCCYILSTTARVAAGRSFFFRVNFSCAGDDSRPSSSKNPFTSPALRFNPGILKNEGITIFGLICFVSFQKCYFSFFQMKMIFSL